MKYFLFLIMFTSKSLLAQLTLSYFPWQNMLGITKTIPKVVAVDYKIETNTFFNNLNMELGIRRYHSFNTKIDHVEYLELFNRAVCHYGAGIAFNPTNFQKNIKTINGYYIDLGIRWLIPTRDFLAIVLECSPYMNQALTNGNLRTRLGLAYRISK
ncbi:MAG: hypothetical protein IT257_10365 [Chitinophagaceae bacterium]|nr:hypothetical protein [Chitinophagaceae bacterium]